MLESNRSAGRPWRHCTIIVLAAAQLALAESTQTKDANGSGAAAQAAPAAETTEAPPAEAKAWNPFKSKNLTGDWGGLRSDLKDVGFDFSLSYQHQFQQNFRGGLETHNGHDLSGSYDAVIKLDFEKMKLLDNAGFYFKWKGNHGDGINDLVGAKSNVNSDAGGDHPIYVNKWWFWNKFVDDKIELRLGVIETPKDLYDVSLYANHEDKDFLNKQSIRNSTIPHVTGMGAFLKITPADWFYFQAGAFDRQGRKRRTQFDTAFHDEAWYVGLWEMGLTPEWDSPKGPMPGRYRAGFWYDPNVVEIYENTFGGELPTDYEGGNMGFYFGFDQMLWKEKDDPKDSQGLGFYARYGHAHRDVSKISDYWSGGLSYTGLIPARDKDVMGFGVSQSIYSSLYRTYKHSLADRETVYEWYYKCYLTPWLILTPDLQVITNPGGDKDDRDSIVGGLRLRVIF